jgi:hypothetical protein
MPIDPPEGHFRLRVLNFTVLVAATASDAMTTSRRATALARRAGNHLPMRRGGIADVNCACTWWGACVGGRARGS